MKRRNYVGYALIFVAVLTLIVWAISQFVQPILPTNINKSLILFFIVFTSVVGVLANFKDIAEWIRGLFEHQSKLFTLQHLATEHLRFLDTISDSTNPDELENKASELIVFVKSLKMGDLYAKKIADLTKREIPPQIFIGDPDENAIEKRTQKYRKQLQQASPQIRSAVGELLRLQN
jgi:hypothetical protein